MSHSNSQANPTPSDLKASTQKKIDEIADAAKKASDKIIDKSKDAVHSAGEKLEETGKKLREV